ncbi:MAG: dehydro coenzyme reductase / coenzyme F420-0:L-glutamate ligase / coenzyme [Actinomycetota bacterium]|nr:dehydro coenzyme reductase / coenzyme F420-0:L-glutamate ligase / coenzyme [Actinomycetota bacterium]
MIEIIPITGVPEIEPKDDVAAAIVEAAGPDAFRDGDVLVVTQKVVSKSEGRIVSADEKGAAVLGETKRVLRRAAGGMLISETRHGFVCANAGVDESNVELGKIALLPLDPDASARRVRSKVAHLTGTDVGVIVSDTFGRAWRLGQTDVAIGVAGFDPFNDYRGTTDVEGRELHATRICIADEIAGAAEMVMGKADRICAAIVRGTDVRMARGAATEIVRSPGEDMFR